MHKQLPCLQGMPIILALASKRFFVHIGTLCYIKLIQDLCKISCLKA